MFTLVFWRALLERSLSTAAQAALLAVGADQLNVLELSWATVLGFAAGGFVLAVLKGVAAGAVTGDGPGLTHAEVISTPGRHARVED